MIRLVQLQHPQKGRSVALVHGDLLKRLGEVTSVYELAWTALRNGQPLEEVVRATSALETLDYGEVHAVDSEWRLLPSFDHPEEPARCLVTGTGLTHKASAENRQAMHATQKTDSATDSMRMYRWGLEGGRPAAGSIGVAPEWFYKGCGTILRAHGEALEVPEFGLDGGEEAEVAGAYLIDANGFPRRIGLTLANEFSDHKLEEKSYLYLAPSKLRTCAIGPELVVGADFAEAAGTTRIWRGGNILWESGFLTGEKNMSHTLANLEHHHFKYAGHRRPGDAHIHFFGADVFSFGAGLRLEDGDVMELQLDGFGRSLRNLVRISKGREKLVRAEPL